LRENEKQKEKNSVATFNFLKDEESCLLEEYCSDEDEEYLQDAYLDEDEGYLEGEECSDEDEGYSQEEYLDDGSYYMRKNASFNEGESGSQDLADNEISDESNGNSDDNKTNDDAANKNNRLSDYVLQENESALFLCKGNFVVIFATKSGRIIGIDGKLDSVKYEKTSLNIPQNFIDGEISLSIEMKFLSKVMYAYLLPDKILFDEQKNILQIGDGSSCDLTVRIFKNMYVQLNGGEISAIIIDGSVRD
jgi:hypothetical protein